MRHQATCVVALAVFEETARLPSYGFPRNWRELGTQPQDSPFSPTRARSPRHVWSHSASLCTSSSAFRVTTSSATNSAKSLRNHLNLSASHSFMQDVNHC